MHLDEIYNFCLKYFLKDPIFTEVNEKTMIPWVFDEIEFARIFIMIYVISVSKYVNVRSLEKKSEVRPIRKDILKFEKSKI